jgi:hypothetical protein
MLPPFGAYELPYPKSCHVYLNGTQSIPGGGWTVVAINATLWDTYGLYTGGANNYITIPEDGLYLMAGSICSNTANPPYLGVGVFKGGVYNFGIFGTQNIVNTNSIAVVYMNMFSKGDTIDLRAYSSGTTAINIGTSWNTVFLQVLKLPYVTKGF